jgi:hypothetical protein
MRHRVRKRGIGIGLLKMISLVVCRVAGIYLLCCLSFSWCIVVGDIGYVVFLHGWWDILARLL